MSDRIDLAKSWFQFADDDILCAEHELKYEDAVLIAKEVRNRILQKLNF